MPTPPETVTLAIDGKTHSQWSRYDIDSDLLVPADDFSVALAPPAAAAATVIPGSRVKVRVGGEVVLDGSIDRIETQTAKDGRTMTLSGRDRAGVLLDCSAPLIAAERLDLAAIVERLVRPLGIDKVQIDSAGKIAKVQIEPGIRVWDALTRYCEASGVWPWCAPDGTLVVGGPDYTAAPVAELVLRTSGRGNNIETIAVSRAIDGRYSEITLLGQAHDGQNAIRATIKDSGVTVHRPLVIVDPDIDIDSQAAAVRRARKLLADSRLAGFEMRIQVKGHRTAGGQLWTPGQRVRVLSEPDGVDGIYFLIGRRFFAAEDQSPATELRLKEDGAWVLDANPVKIQGKRRKQKSAAAQLVTI